MEGYAGDGVMEENRYFTSVESFLLWILCVAVAVETAGWGSKDVRGTIDWCLFRPYINELLSNRPPGLMISCNSKSIPLSEHPPRGLKRSSFVVFSVLVNAVYVTIKLLQCL